VSTECLVDLVPRTCGGGRFSPQVFEAVTNPATTGTSVEFGTEAGNRQSRTGAGEPLPLGRIGWHATWVPVVGRLPARARQLTR
jgi:hypothetical protein